MKNSLFLIIIVAIFSFTVTSCGSKNESSHSSSSSEFKIQGMTPTEYYNQFIFDAKLNCKEGLGYFYFTSTQEVKINTLDNGHDLYAEVNLIINKNGTYKALYQEIEIIERMGNSTKFYIHSKDEFINKWSVTNDGKMIFENLGVAESLIYNGGPAMIIKFDRDISTSGLINKKTLARISNSSSIDTYTVKNECAKTIRN